MGWFNLTDVAYLTAFFIFGFLMELRVEYVYRYRQSLCEMAHRLAMEAMKRGDEYLCQYYLKQYENLPSFNSMVCTFWKPLRKQGSIEVK